MRSTYVAGKPHSFTYSNPLTPAILRHLNHTHSIALANPLLIEVTHRDVPAPSVALGETTVLIIGAGVSGLTLATFLKKSGISCVVLERCDRAYIQIRQRAGVVQARGVRMFERWGLADKLLGGPVAQTIDYRINGSSNIFETAGDDGSPAMTYALRLIR